MKKSLLVSLFILGLTILSLPAALFMVDSEKEKILINEEVLSGNPAEAAGITLKIPSHWRRQLLWDTEYTIGSGTGAESHFIFSSVPVYWKATEEKTAAELRIQIDWDFWTAYVENSTNLNEENSTHSEIIRIADYSANYPLAFDIEGHSVQYEGDYDEACNYLRDYFHISPAEERIEATIGVYGQEEITASGVQFIESDENISIVNAADDDGKGGLYFVYGLENAQTGEWADRGQNRGIFYFPYQEQEFWHVDLTQVEKLCDFPDNAIPLQMLIDNEEETLYLAVREKEGHSLFVYQLEGKTPVLMQQIPVDQNNFSAIMSNPEDDTARLIQPSFCQMSLEEGGILLTWNNNRFSFITKENEKYRLWCSGVFPGEPFPNEQVCIFNGEKLILAAYEGWYSTNVLLSVYDEQGQTYSGRYVHSGDEDNDAGYDSYNKIVPQGNRPGSTWYSAYRYSAYKRSEDKFVEPLEIIENSY